MKRTYVVTGQVTFADGGAEAILRGERTELGEVRYGAVRRARLLVKYLAARLRLRRVFTTIPQKEARR